MKLLPYFAGAGIFFSAQTARAQGFFGSGQFQQTVQLNQSTDLMVILANIINVVLGFLGVILVVLLLYAGFLWMTSAGNEEKIATAKGIIRNALVGVIIVLSSFVFVNWLFGVITGNRVGNTNPFNGIAASRFSSSFDMYRNASALGSGMIESHYPRRDAGNVPRNTRIIVTFKDAMDPTSFTADGVSPVIAPGQSIALQDLRQLKSGALRIYKTADIPEGGDPSTASVSLPQVEARVYTTDARTFVIRPAQLLGGEAQDTSYTVVITNELKRADGKPLFDGQREKAYVWTFTVGTVVDVTPPRIVSVSPRPDNGVDKGGVVAGIEDAPRNSLIQIRFNEPIDPTAFASVTTTGEGGQAVTAPSLVTIKNDAGVAISGIWSVSNDYQVAEFTPQQQCGVNACGQSMFCLPPESRILVHIPAAQLDGSGPAGLLGTGLTDGAGNSLDASADGIAQGRSRESDLNVYNGKDPFIRNAYLALAGGDKREDYQNVHHDTYQWYFFTSTLIDISPPIITGLSPGIKQSSVDSTAPVVAIFNKPMSVTSMTSSSMPLSAQQFAQDGEAMIALAWGGWYSVGAVDVVDPQSDPENPRVVYTTSFTTHASFGENTDISQSPNSTLRDIYQNCYYPTAGSTTLPVVGGEFACGANQLTPQKPYCCNGEPVTSLDSCALRTASP